MIIKFIIGIALIILIVGCTQVNIELDNRCSLEPETGTCKAYIPRYYFDSAEGICKEFIWGGCKGVVPFEILEECQSTCE